MRGTPVKRERASLIYQLHSILCCRGQYISKEPEKEVVNFTLLEAVIKESPELWERVKIHSTVS